MASERPSRREFMEPVGVTAVSAAVAAKDEIRLGIIGAGNRGMGVLDTLLTHPEVDCIALADMDVEQAAACAESDQTVLGCRSKVGGADESRPNPFASWNLEPISVDSTRSDVLRDRRRNRTRRQGPS